MKTNRRIEAYAAWKRWRAISDRVIAHPDYRYDSRKKFLLIKLARFAMAEMAHFNNLYWKLTTISYAAEVIADGSGKFAGNGLRFATRKEAEEYARDLMSRWMLVSEWRVVESTDPINR